MPRTQITGSTTSEGKNLVGYDVGITETAVQEEFDTTTNGSTVVMTVDYADGGAFLRDMLGYATKEGTKLVRVLPEKSGWDDDTYAVAAKSVMHLTWIDNGGEQSWPQFTDSVYAVTYAAPLYKVLEDADVEEELTPGGTKVQREYKRYCVWRTKGVAQNEKIPGGGFKFNDGSGVILYEVGVKTGRQVELSCKWIDVPFVDYARLSSLCNKVNAADVVWNGATYTAETVLFVGWDVEARNNHFGDATHDITFNFAIRADGRSWNRFWKNGADGYVEVVDSATGTNKVFTTADLNTLWEFSS